MKTVENMWNSVSKNKSLLNNKNVMWAVIGTAAAGALVSLLLSSYGKEARTKMADFFKDVVDKAVGLSGEYFSPKPTNGHTTGRTVTPNVQ